MLWSPQSQSPPCLSSSGTGPCDHRHGHTPRSEIQYGKAQSAPPFFSRALAVRAPLPRHAAHNDIIYNILVQTTCLCKQYAFRKLIDILHVHLGGGRQAERWDPLELVWFCLWFPLAQPLLRLGESRAGTVRKAGEGSLSREPSESKEYAVANALVMRAITDSLCFGVFLPSRQHTNCVYPHP